MIDKQTLRPISTPLNQEMYDTKTRKLISADAKNRVEEEEDAT